MSKSRKFYVYVYLDPRKPGQFNYGSYQFEFQPFYVGKGSGYRKEAHIWEASKTAKRNHKLNTIRCILSKGMQPLVRILKGNLTEKHSYILEKRVVARIGTTRDGGTLTNITEGGKGGGSGKYNAMYGVSREQRFINKYGFKLGKRKYAEFQAKGYATRESRNHINGMKGKKFKDVILEKYGRKAGAALLVQIKEKQRSSNLGKHCSPETRKRISQAKRGKVGWKLGQTYCSETNKFKLIPEPGCIFVMQLGQVFQDAVLFKDLYFSKLYSVPMLSRELGIRKQTVINTFKHNLITRRTRAEEISISNKRRAKLI